MIPRDLADDNLNTHYEFSEYVHTYIICGAYGSSRKERRGVGDARIRRWRKNSYVFGEAQKSGSLTPGAPRRAAPTRIVRRGRYLPFWIIYIGTGRAYAYPSYANGRIYTLIAFLRPRARVIMLIWKVEMGISGRSGGLWNIR